MKPDELLKLAMEQKPRIGPTMVDRLRENSKAIEVLYQEKKWHQPQILEFIDKALGIQIRPTTLRRFLAEMDMASSNFNSREMDIEKVKEAARSSRSKNSMIALLKKTYPKLHAQTLHRFCQKHGIVMPNARRPCSEK